MAQTLDVVLLFFVVALAAIAAFPRVVVRFLVTVNRPRRGPKELPNEERAAQALRVGATVIALLAGLMLLRELT